MTAHPLAIEKKEQGLRGKYQCGKEPPEGEYAKD
jgi:hypothetical protein